MATRTRLKTQDGKSNQIGGRLRERIETLGLTHDQVSARIAATTSGVWNPGRLEVTKMIAGLRAITTVELKAIADALDTSECWLLGRD